METRILDGRRIAAEMKEDLQLEIQSLKETGLTPGLAAVLVGADPASHVYVRSKTRTCSELGMHSEQILLPEATSTDELLNVIGELNRNDSIDGILVQLPLPAQVDEQKVLQAVHPAKDVDGFHPLNAGKLCAGQKALAPCTPMGILEMLKREKLPLQGARAVVIGRSNVVGKPMALLLLHEHCTVTICHSRTRDLAAVCREADLLIAAVGRPGLVTRDHVRPGATVIDVGMNRIETEAEFHRLFGDDPARRTAFQEKGYALAGDVHAGEVMGVAAALTPVPGGVGPLTIAQLMKNTVLACRMRRRLSPRRQTVS